jgi:hypothetical protein
MNINEKAPIATPLDPLTTHLSSGWIIFIFPYSHMSYVLPYWLPSTIQLVLCSNLVLLIM